MLVSQSDRKIYRLTFRSTVTYLWGFITTAPFSPTTKRYSTEWTKTRDI